MKGFNLANFKKVKETKDWATLIHKDGHTINIAKAPLLPIQRKQLESLATHEVNQYAEGGEADSGPSQQQPSELDSIMADVNADNPSNQAPQTAAPAQPDVAQGAADAAQTPIPTQASSPQTLGQAQNAGLTQEQQANLQLAQAQGQEGANQAKAYQQTADALSGPNGLPTQQQIIAANQEKDQKLANDFAAQKINPDHYFQNHSKLAAGIGTALSGIGQIFGQGRIQNNGAIDALQMGINRDIDAQKANQGQALTLWQMNRQALGNDLAADLATKNQLNTALQYKIQQTAAASQKPQALAQAQIANAKIQQLKDQNNFKFSLLNPTSDNPDPASRIQFLVPPEQQAKVADAMNAAKNTVANAPGILEAFDQASKEVRPLSGGTSTSGTAFIPGLKSPGQQALQARLGPTFQDVEGTVRQAAMDNLDHNITPKFGDDDKTIATKRASLTEYLKSKSAASLPKAYGIDLTKYPSTNTTTIGQAVQPQVKVVNGVKYTRAPNGQAIPVK
jgi:hypothetical protein